MWGIDCRQLSIDQLHYGVPSKWDSGPANTPEFISVKGSIASALKALFRLCPPLEYLCPRCSVGLSGTTTMAVSTFQGREGSMTNGSLCCFMYRVWNLRVGENKNKNISKYQFAWRHVQCVVYFLLWIFWGLLWCRLINISSASQAKAQLIGT